MPTPAEAAAANPKPASGACSPVSVSRHSRDYIQHLMITYNGKEYEKEHTYIHIFTYILYTYMYVYIM